MEKPSKINEDTYKEFVVAMKKIIDVPGYAPSRNYLKREISSPTRYVVCSECKAGGVTL